MSPRPRLPLLAALLVVVACAGGVEDRLAEVRSLQDAGQFNESIQPLHELLAKDPDQPEANYLLGVALVQTGQLSLAVWPLEKASEDPSQAAAAGLLLASTFLGLQAHEDAVRVASKILEKDPDRVAALKVRAQALLGANRREDALKDTTRLRELAPDDYAGLLLHATILAELGRLDEADKAHAELEDLVAKSGDANLAVRGCLARATFYKDNRKDDALAEAHFKTCLEKGPTNPLALRLVSQYYDERKRTAEATAVWEKALAEAPDNLSIRSSLASRYESEGKLDQARSTLQAGVDLLGNTQAWYALSEFERRNGHADQALDAVEKAIAAAPSPNPQLLFFKADLLVDLGRLDEADALAASLEEPAYRDLLHGRVLLARGDAKGALATFDTGLKRWPNNAGARYLAGIAAFQVGDFARAESEFHEALRVDAGGTDAAYALATLYLAQGRNQEAAESARQFVSTRGAGRPGGYLVYIRAAIPLGNFEGAQRTADALANVGFPQEAAAARAQIELAQHGADAALRSAQASGIDLGAPAADPLLRAIAERMVADGHVREAADLVAASIAKHPDSAPLHEIQGVLLVRLGRDAEAQASFEKALALDPKTGRAKAGLATLAVRAGDLPRAIALYDEAVKLAPNDSNAAFAAAQLAAQTGDAAGARQRLEAIVARDPGHAGARNDLAWMLVQPPSPDLDRALALAEAAHRMDPNPEISDTLAWIYLQRGQVDDSVALLQKAAQQRPESQTIRYHLGVALGRQGDRQRAVETLRQAVEAGPFPEADAAKSELARLEQQP